MKKLFNKETFKWIIIVMIIIQPLIELDYLMYDFLNQFGIPRLSTIFRFIIMPLIVIGGFFVFDKNKKRTIIFTTIYGVILGTYFILHTQNAIAIRQDLYLPPNFYFNLFHELTYVMTMVLPYFFMYVIYQASFKDKFVKMISLGISTVISIPILLSNLFVFGHSTYVGYTQANFISWFFGIYETVHPRQLASKFFFVEGNTIGIVLFMLLPILYYYFYKATHKKERIAIGSLIVVQSLSMIILSTRTATYGAILGAVAFLGIYLFCTLIMKNAKFEKLTLIFTVLVITMCGIIIPVSPAIVNQQIDNVNDKAVLDDNYILEEGKGGVSKDLGGAKTKYDPALVYAFEQYAIKSNLLSTVPTMYYMEWYKYTYDAYWWLDLLFNVPFHERVNGRQIQTLFIEYKWSEAPNPTVDYALGLGYSTMMNGSLILERDFVQQYYSFGYIGWILMVAPWILVTLIGAFLVLRHPKKNLRMDVLIFAAAVCFGLFSAYSSGHTLDEFTSSVFMAFLVGILLHKLLKGDRLDERD